MCDSADPALFTFAIAQSFDRHLHKPCIRYCTYSGRRVFYNFDGMEKVQPLVHIYHPRNERVHRFPEAFYGIDDDDDIKNQMQSHDGVYTNIYKS